MNKVLSTQTYSINKSEFTDWESVFNNPAPIRIETLKTGSIISRLSGLINLKDSKAAQLSDGFVKIPVLAHLISHDKYGDYLIDTGFDSSFSQKPGGNFKGFLKGVYFKNHYLQEYTKEGIEIQLKDKSICLNGVFLTHTHEHASGAPSLSDDIPFIYGSGECESGKFPFVYSAFLENKSKLFEFDFSTGNNMPILGKCIDIFGDGSLWAVSTTGHTKGHTSYIINGTEMQVLVIGDACSTCKGFELGVGTGSYSENSVKSHESFLKLQEFLLKYPNVIKVFGHETNEYKVEYL